MLNTDELPTLTTISFNQARANIAAKLESDTNNTRYISLRTIHLNYIQKLTIKNDKNKFFKRQVLDLVFSVLVC